MKLNFSVFQRTDRPGASVNSGNATSASQDQSANNGDNAVANTTLSALVGRSAAAHTASSEAADHHTFAMANSQAGVVSGSATNTSVAPASASDQSASATYKIKGNNNMSSYLVSSLF